MLWKWLLTIGVRLLHAGVSVEGWRDTMRIHKDREEVETISLEG
jgi:hypothetical protein